MTEQRLEKKAGPIAWFRRFRWTRPFWGGLFTIVGGVIIGALPLGPNQEILHLGVGGIAGFICAIVLIVLGLYMWFLPSQRIVAALVAVIVSLISFPLSNLGGFVVGMLAGILGGCLTFGWVPDRNRKTWRQRRAERKAAKRARSSSSESRGGAGESWQLEHAPDGSVTGRGSY